jgi:DNA-directed RNA polymerase specialized sigma24 family protein
MSAGNDGFQLFPTTHWSLVVRAGQDASQTRRDALGELLQRYMGALRTFLITRYRLSRDRADDMVQGFILSRLVEKNLLGKADADRGKFRNFLMTALERYAVDQFREASAQKRQGDHNIIDVQDQQNRLGAATDNPAAAFDVSWASEVIRQTIERMKQATETTRPDLWGVFKDRVLGPAFDGAEPSSYAELIGRLGFKDEGQAASALQTAKRIFSRLLRGIVAEYAMTASEVDEEVGELLSALGGVGGR